MRPRLPWLFFAVTPIALAVAYGSVLVTNYGFQDDFSYLLYSNFGMLSFFDGVPAQNGRLLYNIMLVLLFGMVEHIADLWVLRLVAIAGVFIGAVLLHRLFRSAGMPSWESGALALLMVTTPAFGEYVGWTCCCPLPLGAALGIASGSLAWRAFAPGAPQPGRLALAVLLLFSAEQIYQSAAGFFMFPAVVYLAASRERSSLARAVKTAALFCVVLVVYYASYKLLVKHAYGATPYTTRGTLAYHPLDKLAFVIHEPLCSGLQHWAAFARGAWRVVVTQVSLVLCAAGFLQIAWVENTAAGRNGGRRWDWFAMSAAKVVFTLAAFVLAVAPILIVKDDYAPHRTLPVLYAFILFLSAQGLKALAVFLPETAKRRFVRGALATMAVLSIAACGHYVKVGFVDCNAFEIQRYRDHFARAFPEYPKAVVFVRPALTKPPHHTIRTIHSYSLQSTWPYWSAQHLTSLLLNEQFGVRKRKGTEDDVQTPLVVPVDKTVVWSDRWLPVLQGYTILGCPEGDIAPKTDSATMVADPYFGTIEPLDGGWAFSPWFGFFRKDRFPDIQHTHLGRLKCAGKGKDEFLFQHRERGWLWTSPSVFPRFHQRDREVWLVAEFGKDASVRFTERPDQKGVHLRPASEPQTPRDQPDRIRQRASGFPLPGRSNVGGAGVYYDRLPPR